MKLSQHKSNLPGRKQIYRFYEQGRMVRDVITAFDEPSDGTPLLECVMKEGRRTEAGTVTLDQARAHARGALRQLPDHLMTLDETDLPYPVNASRRLHENSERLEGELAEKAGRIVQASDIA
jgi:nicotinate phosphoribosyltransferase